MKAPLRLAALTSLFAQVACGTADRIDDPVTRDPLQMTDLPVYLRAPITSGTFQQAIDHDGTTPGTFAQRYHYSNEFAGGPDSPVLFRFCGDAPCTSAYLQSLGDVAKSLHAAVVTLEHRYYGESLPFADPSLADMRFLTVDQALEDAATFQSFARTELGLRGKWIAAGSSYAGTLAAFYRAKHPELVVGAWVSSAPIDLRVTFSGFDEIASRTLGSRCTALFRQALQAADTTFDQGGEPREALSRALFGSSAAGLDKASFLRNVSTTATFAAEYGRGPALCSALEQHASSPLDGLAGYRNPPLPADPLVAAPAAPPDSTTPPAPPAGTATTVSFKQRQWLYQSCTELGLFQVAGPDVTQSVMSPLIDQAYFEERCRKFGLTTPDVERLRARYAMPILGGHVKNLFFVNGSEDPWRALAVTQLIPGTNAYLVQGGFRGSDLATLQKESPVGMFEAHYFLHQLAKRWLAEGT